MKATIKKAHWSNKSPVVLEINDKEFSRTCYDLAVNQGITEIDIVEVEEE